MTPFVQELLVLASIPITSAVVGWGTNVLALKMTFYPVDYVGVRPIGWQGIIPAKAESMARRTVELITTKLVGVDEVIDRLDPDRVADALAPAFAPHLKRIVNTTLKSTHPELWALVPNAVKDEIYASVEAKAPEVVRQSVIDLKLEVDQLIDLEHMAVQALLADRAFLNQIFLECGREEFKFIEKSGFYFGFAFGLVVMGLWAFFQALWILPTVGFLIGWATNYLALKMIFEPVEPKRIFGWTWQGSFLKRQDEVSEAYSRLIAQNIVNTRNLLKTLMDGPGTTRLLEIVDGHVKDVAATYNALPDAVTTVFIGGEAYEALKHTIADEIVASVTDGPIFAVQNYAHGAMDIENTLHERLVALPPDQFTGLLRPIFQEDEWKLILVGAVLGLLVGFAQAWLM
ncbi:MAG: hypothetical protein R3E66_13590 [bacterium]